MKRIIFGLMLAMMFCTLVQGANRTVTENDGQGNKKRVIELRDTVINGETVTDTLSIMTYENGTGSSDAPEKWRTHHSSMDWNGFDLGSKTSETVIAVTAIVFVFGLPLLIIFVVFSSAIKTGKPSTAWRNRPWPADSNCLKTSSKKPQQRISAAKASTTYSSASACSSSFGPLPENSVSDVSAYSSCSPASDNW